MLLVKISFSKFALQTEIGEQFDQFEAVIGCDLIRHLDPIFDEHVPITAASLVQRHALSVILSDLVMLRGLRAVVESDQRVVQMLNAQLEAQQGLLQGDVDGGPQIVALSLKVAVFLLLDHRDQIARVMARPLLRLSAKSNLLAVAHSFLDLNLQSGRLLVHPLPSAVMALVLKLLTFKQLL